MHYGYNNITFLVLIPKVRASFCYQCSYNPLLLPLSINIITINTYKNTKTLLLLLICFPVRVNEFLGRCIYYKSQMQCISTGDNNFQHKTEDRWVSLSFIFEHFPLRIVSILHSSFANISEYFAFSSLTRESKRLYMLFICQSLQNFCLISLNMHLSNSSFAF